MTIYLCKSVSLYVCVFHKPKIIVVISLILCVFLISLYGQIMFGWAVAENGWLCGGGVLISHLRRDCAPRPPPLTSSRPRPWGEWCQQFPSTQHSSCCSPSTLLSAQIWLSAIKTLAIKESCWIKPKLLIHYQVHFPFFRPGFSNGAVCGIACVGPKMKCSVCWWAPPPLPHAVVTGYPPPSDGRRWAKWETRRGAGRPTRAQ